MMNEVVIFRCETQILNGSAFSAANTLSGLLSRAQRNAGDNEVQIRVEGDFIIFFYYVR